MEMVCVFCVRIVLLIIFSYFMIEKSASSKFKDSDGLFNKDSNIQPINKGLSDLCHSNPNHQQEYYNWYTHMRNKNFFDDFFNDPDNMKEDVFDKFYDKKGLKLQSDVFKGESEPYYSLLTKELKDSFSDDYHKELSNDRKLHDACSKINPPNKFQSYNRNKNNLKNKYRIARHVKHGGQNLFGAGKFNKYGKIDPFVFNNSQITLSDIDNHSRNLCVDEKTFSSDDDDDDDDINEYANDEVTEDNSDSHNEYMDSAKKNEEVVCPKGKQKNIITSSAHVLDAKVYIPKPKQNSCPPDNDTPVNKLKKDKTKNKLKKKYDKCDEKDLVILQPLKNKLSENFVEDIFTGNKHFYLNKSPNIVNVNHVKKPLIKLSEDGFGGKYDENEVILRPVQRFEIDNADDLGIKNRIVSKPCTKTRHNFGLQYGSQCSENGDEVFVGTGSKFKVQVENPKLKTEDPLNLQFQSLVLNKELVNKPYCSFKHCNSKHRAKHLSPVGTFKRSAYPEAVFSIHKNSDINKKLKLKISPAVHKSELYLDYNGNNNYLKHDFKPVKSEFLNCVNDKRHSSDVDNVTSVRYVCIPNHSSNVDLTGYAIYNAKGENFQYGPENKEATKSVYNSEAESKNNLNSRHNNGCNEYFLPKDIPFFRNIVPSKRSLNTNQNDDYRYLNKGNMNADCSEVEKKVFKKSIRNSEPIGNINYYDLRDNEENIGEGDYFDSSRGRDRSSEKYLSKEFINKSNKLLDNSDSDDKTKKKSNENIYHATNQETVTKIDEKYVVPNKEKFSFYLNKDPEKILVDEKSETQKTTAAGRSNSPLKKLPNPESKSKDNGSKLPGKQCHPPSGPPKFRWCSEETDPVSDQEYEDALRGKIALRIVEVILAKVHKSSKMTSDFGFCKATKKPVNSDINECENQNSFLKSQDLKNIMKSMETLSYNGCNQLPNKLKEFLEWLVKVKPIRSVYLKEKTYKRCSQPNCSLQDSAFLFHNYNLLLSNEYQDPRITESGFNNEVYGSIDEYDNVPKVDINIKKKNEFNSNSDFMLDEKAINKDNILVFKEPKLSYVKRKQYTNKNAIKCPNDKRDNNVETSEDFFLNPYSAVVFPNSYIGEEGIDRNSFERLLNFPINNDKVSLPVEKLLSRRRSSCCENDNDFDTFHKENSFQEVVVPNSYAGQLRQKRNNKRLQLRELFLEKYPDLNLGLQMDQLVNSNDGKKAEDDVDMEKKKLCVANTNDQQMGFYTPVVIHIPEEYDT